MKELLALFRFMTRLPLGADSEFDSDDLGKGMKYFPVVGMVIGIILFMFYMIFNQRVVFTPLLMIVFLVMLEVILTGGLHLDGLADTFDGIFSYRSKQKMLEIMKDSRLGTNGGMALIFYFVLKIALLYDLQLSYGVSPAFVLLFAPAMARLNSVLNCATEPYARVTGMGKTFIDNTGIKELLIATGLTFVYSAAVLAYFKVTFFLLAVIPVLMLLGFGFSKLITRKIGGATGDTLGALVEISEVVGIFLLYIATRIYSLYLI